MAAATFNDSRFPTVTPWDGTTLRWFGELANDRGMWQALTNSLIVAAGVLASSLAAAQTVPAAGRGAAPPSGGTAPQPCDVPQ